MFELIHFNKEIFINPNAIEAIENNNEQMIIHLLNSGKTITLSKENSQAFEKFLEMIIPNIHNEKHVTTLINAIRMGAKMWEEQIKKTTSGGEKE